MQSPFSAEIDAKHPPNPRALLVRSGLRRLGRSHSPQTSAAQNRLACSLWLLLSRRHAHRLVQLCLAHGGEISQVLGQPRISRALRELSESHCRRAACAPTRLSSWPGGGRTPENMKSTKSQSRKVNQRGKGSNQFIPHEAASVAPSKSCAQRVRTSQMVRACLASRKTVKRKVRSFWKKKSKKKRVDPSERLQGDVSNKTNGEKHHLYQGLKLAWAKAEANNRLS